jgi:hypothetical protein
VTVYYGQSLPSPLLFSASLSSKGRKPPFRLYSCPSQLHPVHFFKYYVKVDEPTLSLLRPQIHSVLKCGCYHWVALDDSTEVWNWPFSLHCWYKMSSSSLIWLNTFQLVLLALSNLICPITFRNQSKTQQCLLIEHQINSNPLPLGCKPLFPHLISDHSPCLCLLCLVILLALGSGSLLQPPGPLDE